MDMAWQHATVIVVLQHAIGKTSMLILVKDSTSAQQQASGIVAQLHTTEITVTYQQGKGHPKRFKSTTDVR